MYNHKHIDGGVHISCLRLRFRHRHRKTTKKRGQRYTKDHIEEKNINGGNRGKNILIERRYRRRLEPTGYRGLKYTEGGFSVRNISDRF